MIELVPLEVIEFEGLSEEDRFIVVAPRGPSSDFNDGHISYILQKFSCRSAEERRNYGGPSLAIREKDGLALAIPPNTKVIRVVGERGHMK